MFKFRYFKKFILPSSLAATAVGVAEPSEFDGNKKRPGDLSLYDEPKEKITPEEKEEESALENDISKIREEVWVWYDHVKGYREKVVEVVVTAKEHSEVLVQSLRNDELPVPRSGAVAIGGLAGFIFGLRCGWFRRIFYGSTCAGIMAAICYPRETKEFTQEALAVTKKYVLISYNFIYGVKRDNFMVSAPCDFLGGSKETVEGKKDDISTPETSEKEASKISDKKKPPQNDQSDPADKDLYTNRK